MLRRRHTIILLGLAAIASGTLAIISTVAGAESQAPEPAAFGRQATAEDALVAQIGTLSDSRRIAVAIVGGQEHRAYVAKDKEGRTCLVTQEGSYGRGGASCNPSRDPFLGSHVLWSSDSFNESPQKLVLSGVVAKGVSAVSLVVAGSEVAVPLSADGGFVYVVAKQRISQEDVPTAILMFDASGRRLERTVLGITFGG